MPVHNKLKRLSFVVLTLAAVLGGCKPEGGGGSGSKDNVSLFSSRARITRASGANDVDATALFTTAGGLILLTDAASGSVLALDVDGTVFLLTSKADLTAVTGQGSVALGPFDQIGGGILSGQLLAADAVSGNLLLIDTNGKPSLFSTKAKITGVTMRATANMILPRELTNNQVVAQDLESLSILRFDPEGNPTVFADAITIASAAGVAPAQAIVAQWVKGAGTGSLFGRVAGSNNLVRLQINGTINRHVSGPSLTSLFRDVIDLEILDMVAAIDSDALLLLIGDGTRGVAVALVGSNGRDIAINGSRKEFADVAGEGVNLSDLAVLPSNVPVLVDRGGAQVLTQGDNGQPVIVGRGQDIRDTANTANPRLSIAAGHVAGGAVVVDEESDTVILVE